MPRELGGKIYYNSREVCEKIGIAHSTLYIWIRNGVLEKSYRDRNGWRIFTDEDVETLKSEANRIESYNS